MVYMIIAQKKNYQPYYKEFNKEILENFEDILNIKEN